MTQYRVHNVHVDTERREVMLDGELQPIEPRGFDVLAYLILHADRAVPKSELLDHVWQGRVVTDGVLTQAVSKARRIFGSRADEVIKTVHRVGYRFVGPIEMSNSHRGDAGLQYFVAVSNFGEKTELARLWDESLLPESAGARGNVALFADSSLAVKAALAALSAVPACGIGIHLANWNGNDAESARSVQLTGEVARLALPGQILVTGAAFELSRQQLGAARTADLSWLAHGQFEFGTLGEVVRIYETGATHAPMRQPEEQADIVRVSGEDVILGWRAAPGQRVPHRSQWELKRVLGEGGFGEAWLAIHRRTHERRVFKFCYRADRLRSLQREVTLFRLLNETLGRREDIARILDWNFEEAPYFVESEYTGQGDIEQWAEDAGGLNQVPLATRLQLFEQTARAVAAAHAVGILHKDVKPGNILIKQAGDAPPKAVLCDFGIGLITDLEPLDQHDITKMGVTEAVADNVTTSRSGTRRYMAPELLEGHPATIQADIYSLGVILYQLCVGDFGRVLAPGWERDVDDEFLAADIASMVDGDPARRLGDANLVATRVETLEARRREREQLRAREEAVARLARRRRILLPVAAAACIVAVVMTVLAFQIRKQAIRADAQSQLADQQRARAEQSADFLAGLFDNANPYRFAGKDLTAKELLQIGQLSLQDNFDAQPEVKAALYLTIAEAYLGLGAFDEFNSALAEAENTVDLHDYPESKVKLLRLRGEAAANRDEFEQSRESLAAAVSLARQHDLKSEEVRAIFQQAETETFARQAEAAVSFARQAAAFAEATWGADSPDTVTAKGTLAFSLANLNEYEEAESLYEALIEVLEHRNDEESFVAANIRNSYSQMLLQLSRFDEAAQQGERALVLARKYLPTDHREIATIASNLGNALNYANRREEAETVLLEALDIRQRTLGEHSDTALSHTNLAGFYMRFEQWEQAEEHVTAALALHRSLLGDSYLTAISLHDYGSILLTTDRLDAALPMFEEATLMLDKELGRDHWITGVIHGSYAQALTESGELDKGVEEATLAVEILSRALPEGHFRRASARAQLANALLENGDALAAQAQLDGQLELVARELGEDAAEYVELVKLESRIGKALAASQ